MGVKPIGERVCLDCDALAVEGSMRCAPCRDKALKENKAAHRARQAVRYEKLGVPSRRLTGTCPDCGKAIRSDSTRCLPCSLVFIGKRKEQRAAEAAATKALRAEQVRVAREQKAAAARAEAEKIRAEKAAARQMEYASPAPRVVAQRQPVLPYAYRNLRPGSMSEALRIDTGVRHESH